MNDISTSVIGDAHQARVDRMLSVSVMEEYFAAVSTFVLDGNSVFTCCGILNS